MDEISFEWDGTWMGEDGIVKTHHAGFTVSNRVCVHCGKTRDKHITQVTSTMHGTIKNLECPVSEKSLAEQLVAIPLGDLKTAVRYDKDGHHILRVWDLHGDPHDIIAPSLKRIGCQCINPNMTTLCKDCINIPGSVQCDHVKNTFRYTPLYKGMCGY